MANDKGGRHYQTTIRVTVVHKRPGQRKPETDTVEVTVTRKSTQPQATINTKDLLKKVFGGGNLPALTTRRDPGKK